MKIVQISASLILATIIVAVSLNILTSFHVLSQRQPSVTIINGGETSKHYVPTLQKYELKQQKVFHTQFRKLKEYKPTVKTSDLNNATSTNQDLQKCRSDIKKINENLESKLIVVKNNQQQIKKMQQQINSFAGGKPQACIAQNNQKQTLKWLNARLQQDAANNIVFINNLKKDISTFQLNNQNNQQSLKQCTFKKEKLLLLQSQILISKSITSSLKSQIDALTNNNQLLEEKLNNCSSNNGQQGDCKKFVRQIIQANKILAQCQNDYKILQQKQESNQRHKNNKQFIQDQLQVWTKYLADDIIRIAKFTRELLINNNISHLNISSVNKTLNSLEHLTKKQFQTFKQASSNYSQHIQEIIQGLNGLIKDSNTFYSQKARSFEDTKSKLVKGLEYATKSLLECNNKLTGRK